MTRNMEEVDMCALKPDLTAVVFQIVECDDKDLVQEYNVRMRQMIDKHTPLKLKKTSLIPRFLL